MRKKLQKLANNLLKGIEKIPFGKYVSIPLKKVAHFFSSWKHLLASLVFALIFLYYPLGGLIVNNIDRDTALAIDSANQTQSATVSTVALIIDREVNDKLWTPNLPFIFPSYFLDNMPNFQLGMIEASAAFTNAFSQKVGIQNNLKQAAELLKYPGEIWMLSLSNSLVPAPSANSQYRRARKFLLKYNQDLLITTDSFYKKPEDLSFFLKKTNKNLSKTLEELETHIRETSSDWTDFKADDLFYYNQGKLYAHYLILKSLGYDYKDIIIEQNLYQSWIKMLKALETGASLDPAIVRNGELDSSTAPNHLNYLGFYTLKAQNSMQRISAKLDAGKKNAH